jgi:HlyD family secretion protein
MASKSTSILILLVSVFLGCNGNSDDVIEASGTIEGTDVNVSVEAAGKVLAVSVDEGSRVQKGDTLLILDDADYQLQYRQAIANLDAGEAQYRLALDGARKEDILQAEVMYKTAEADYQRMKELLASQTITQKQYDDVYARYISAQQSYEKLFRGLRKEEILAARARRDQAAAQVDQIAKKIRDCTLRAPVAGTVTLRVVEPGEFVGSSARVFRLTSLDEVDLTIYVPETQLGFVRLGQSAMISIDTYEDKDFEGTVVHISDIAEFTPKNVQTKEERAKLVFGVKIKAKNPDGALKPGLPADARIDVSEKK